MLLLTNAILLIFEHIHCADLRSGFLDDDQGLFVWAFY